MHTSPRPSRSFRWRRPLAWAAVLAALLLVFSWYLQPSLMVQLANQLWNCF
ncbi:hypothetical protein [Caldimonas brevitalea]|uniref:Uncharacterized protein n=1 Tax=Caldimonas brevitalea TaxID=413882 RepID=A0A0G3BGF2_9BURK|nr:hypothetical protein [Caldimonas brevitalea]AKJ28387.1 hypothetical protein AAW51_1696 [Caldimonas brevitalea]